MAFKPPIISKNIRVRYPEHFVVGPGSIVDDFCYFSTKVRIGACSHVCPGVTIAGGVARQFVLGDYSSLASGTRVYCTSNDYVNDVVTIVPADAGVDEKPITGDVIFGNYAGVGANSVIMPRNVIPEGTVIGALSYVPPEFEFKPWAVYAGVPIKHRGERNKERVLAQARRLDALKGS
ncbi:hypothetical protein HY251_02045 [bacterium]|nr:hypothetical protein [bacterium]